MYLGLKLQIEAPFDVNTKLLVVSADHVIVPFGYLVLPYVRNIGLKKCKRGSGEKDHFWAK